MKRLMNFMILSCKRSSALIDQSAIIKLNFIENIQLTIHKSICSACNAYQNQSNDLDDILDHILKDQPDLTANTDRKLSRDLKNKIIDQIRKK